MYAGAPKFKDKLAGANIRREDFYSRNFPLWFMVRSVLSVHIFKQLNEEKRADPSLVLFQNHSTEYVSRWVKL